MKKVNIIGEVVIEVLAVSSVQRVYDIFDPLRPMESPPLYVISYDTLKDYKKRKKKKKKDEFEFMIEQASFSSKEETESALKKIVDYVKNNKKDLTKLDEFCNSLKGNLTYL